ncbi:hypothetical protein ARMGADRAFT_57676 [Armillaria gallica]|uniref:Uncharacterized protein n=1 Tax=Armillaria gallica TaxID=47427 RepID=A0A2H3EAZ2_ARMGA|nr:hypothetical protein ARMGADRAFT_57676 [Armillaria gallica]
MHMMPSKSQFSVRILLTERNIASSDACALDKNRKLKDTSEIDWYEDGDDAAPMKTARPSTETTGCGQRKKNTEKLKALIVIEQDSDDGAAKKRLKKCHRPRKGKKKVVKDGSGIGEKSGSDYTEMSGSEESDSESEVEIPDDKVSDLSSS